MQSPFAKESILYEKIDQNTLRCATCERRCFISEGKTGFCRTRINHHNKLYTLVYGNISSICNNPIEKKPLYHFFPGSKAFTVGTWGCNFTCPFCQNWEISKIGPLMAPENSLSVPQFIQLLEKHHSQGTSFSLNEPTLLLEYALDLMEAINPLRYYHTYVTNMYMTEMALELLIKHGCRAFCVNLKGNRAFYSKYCSADVDLVWRNLHLAKLRGCHIEVVTLLIPHENDSDAILKEIASIIKTRLGEDVPWHCNQYHPAYKAQDVGLADYPTPISTLERAHQIGKAEGLKFVYIGNVHRHRFVNTYCPDCGTLLIERSIFGVSHNFLTPQNTCPRCATAIPVIVNLEPVLNRPSVSS